MEKTINVYPKQLQFLQSKALLRAFVGGIGSGKSFIGALDVIRRSKPSRLYLATAPCYDDQTEILTEARGWQLFKNLLPDDRVATLQDGEKLVYHTPLNHFIYPYDGEIIDLENQEICLSMTPNHRCYTRFKEGQWQIKTAEELYGKWDWKFKKTVQWRTEPNLTNEQRLYWEFLGFWFAEGYAEASGKKYRIVITQKKYVDYAEQLIANFSKIYREDGKYGKDKRKGGGFNFTLYHKEAALQFVQYGKSHTKKLPLWIKQGSVEQLKAFLRGYIAGDGHVKVGSHDQTNMWTKSKSLADDLSEIIFKAGYAACQAVHNRGMHYICIRTASKNEPATAPKHWSKRKYVGSVYCVEVPGGIVYVRKNGKPCWCGNTYPMLSDATFRSFVGLIRQLDIANPDEIKSSPPQSIRLKNTAEIIFRSTDNPEMLRGPNLSGVLMDEASLSKQEAFDILLGRLREGGEMGWLSATFTPKGKVHWTYRVFGTGQPDTELVHARSDENPFLPKQFVSNVRKRYTAQQSQQELGGVFLEGGGNHYHPHLWPRYVDTGDAYRISDGSRWKHIRKADCSRLLTLDWAMGKPKSDAKSVAARASGIQELKGDHTCFIVADLSIEHNILFLLDCLNERIPMGSNAPRLAEMCRRWHPVVVAGDDDNLSETMQLETRRYRDIPTINMMSIGGRNKLVRSQAAIVRAERGMIYLPQGDYGPDKSWIEVLSDQLAGFTGADGEQDDIADSMSIMGRLADEFRPGEDSDDYDPIIGVSGYDGLNGGW